MQYLTVFCGEAVLFSSNLTMAKVSGLITLYYDKILLNDGSGRA